VHPSSAATCAGREPEPAILQPGWVEECTAHLGPELWWDTIGDLAQAHGSGPIEQPPLPEPAVPRLVGSSPVRAIVALSLCRSVPCSVAQAAFRDSSRIRHGSTAGEAPQAAFARMLGANQGWSANRLLRDRCPGSGPICWPEVLPFVDGSGWTSKADLEKQDGVRRWESVLRQRPLSGDAQLCLAAENRRDQSEIDG
jgi:hypothetical protein